jgi:hypothetical protein
MISTVADQQGIALLCVVLFFFVLYQVIKSAVRAGRKDD